MSTAFRGMPPGGVLFEEDFDLPPAPPSPPEPEIIEPVYSAADLQEARTEAWREARDAAMAEAETAARTESRQTLTRIAEHLEATQTEASDLVERSAEAIARLLMDGFAAAFPALSRKHGSAELRAIIRTILPALHQELAVTVRVDGNAAQAVRDEIERLDPDLLPKIEVQASNAVLPGDIRIAWRNGAAIRDTTTLWEEITAILSPAGLMSPGPTSPGLVSPGPMSPGFASSRPVTKEIEHVD